MASFGQRIVLLSRPDGLPKQDHFKMESFELREPTEGEVFVETIYISVDPYMRGRMNAGESYVAPIDIGGVVEGGVIGRVLKSNSDALAVGDMVLASYGWQTHQTLPAEHVRRIPSAVSPVRAALGVLGMTGLTAYLGLLEIGKPKPGETVVVSGAAGAVGLVVGQIARLKGATVIGIAGSDEKCQKLVSHYGYHRTVNYKSPAFEDQVREACRGGVDVYFDNVGGPVSDAVLRNINRGARIAVCGQISQYNQTEAYSGLPIPSLLLVKRALMQGFIVGDFRDQFEGATAQLSQWIANGDIRSEDTVIHGFDHTVDAFLKLFSGENTGKLLVQVKD